MRPPSRRAVIGGAIACALNRPAAQAAHVPLKALAQRRGISFGAAAEAWYLTDDPAYGGLVAQECALITTENALKWNAVEPEPDRFDFAPAEAIARFAARHELALRGHGLIWHEALPAWIGTLTPATARATLEQHIHTVVSQFRGRLSALDVVVEPVERNDGRVDGLRRHPWVDLIGPDYLDMAFHTACAADPAVRLVLEDYGLEYDSIPWMVEKRSTMLTLLRALTGRGVPIGALGLQAHLLGDQPPSFGAGLRDFLRAVADLGLKIEITELDVNDQAVPGSVEQRDQIIGDHYRRFLDAALAEPAVDRVVTWGLADRHSSINSFFHRTDGQALRPLPYDDNLQSKPARAALAAAFSQAVVR